MNTDEIKITIKASQIEKWFKDHIKHEHSKLISKIIVQNLKPTDVGMEKVFKAINGIEDIYAYQPFEEVMVNIKDIYIWKMDKESMKHNGLITKDCIKAKVIEIRPWANLPYFLEVDYLDENGLNQTSTCSVKEESLHPIDYYPMDR